MATTDTLRSQAVPAPFFPSIVPPSAVISRKRKYSSISSSGPQISAMASARPNKVAFDPAKHLCYVPPAKVYSMEEIGRANQGVSPNAVSLPFSLFTEEAVKQMRSEIFSKEVIENCQYSSNLSACQLRGFAAKYAPFIYDAWHSPQVLEIMSKIAGIELVPAMDFEIAHVNISIYSEEEKEAALRDFRNGKQEDDDENPIVRWHTDSYPFVCVLMLSDCTNMIGGETALRTGSGEVMKVRGPGMGSGVVLQGRYIEHQALQAYGTTERITLVTSFRPKSALVKDDTVLTTVRSISDLSELYGQYSEYRLEMLEERVRRQLKDLRRRNQANRRFDTAAVKSFLTEQKAFIDSMLKELVDDDKVVRGLTEDSGVLSEDLIEAANKRIKVYMREMGGE